MDVLLLAGHRVGRSCSRLPLQLWLQRLAMLGQAFAVIAAVSRWHFCCTRTTSIFFGVRVHVIEVQTLCDEFLIRTNWCSAFIPFLCFGSNLRTSRLYADASFHFRLPDLFVNWTIFEKVIEWLYRIFLVVILGSKSLAHFLDDFVDGVIHVDRLTFAVCKRLLSYIARTRHIAA